MDATGGLDRLPDGPVRRMFTAAQHHDLEAMLAEFADDYVNVTPVHPNRTFRGREQVRANWASIFGGIPDFSPDVHDTSTGPDGTVWVEWGARGTRRDGVPAELAGVAIFTVRDDRLAAVRFYLEPVERESGDVNAAVRSAVGPAPAARR